MSTTSDSRKDRIRRNAQNQFSKTEQHADQQRREREAAQAADAAKTAKLRALRLAKEAADKEIADKERAETDKPGAVATKPVRIFVPQG